MPPLAPGPAWTRLTSPPVWVNSVVPEACLPAMLMALVMWSGSRPSILAATAVEPKTPRTQVSWKPLASIHFMPASPTLVMTSPARATPGRQLIVLTVLSNAGNGELSAPRKDGWYAGAFYARTTMA